MSESENNIVEQEQRLETAGAGAGAEPGDEEEETSAHEEGQGDASSIKQKDAPEILPAYEEKMVTQSVILGLDVSNFEFAAKGY
ncbi:UNVERIFIED_CONTAM: hypothetical protein FKN15_049184 [Acipenser sinensis]